MDGRKGRAVWKVEKWWGKAAELPASGEHPQPMRRVREKSNSTLMYIYIYDAPTCER